MKILKYAIVIATLSTLTQSCTKDFLLKEPISDALPSEVNAEPLIGAAYNIMYNTYYTSTFMVACDVQSDNCYAGGDNAGYWQVDKFNVTSTTSLLQDESWGQIYEGIKNANIVLDYVPTIKDPKLTDDRRQQILGEASFLRAWHYFNLVRLWGSVPVITKVPASVKEMFSPKKPVDSVYALIIKDLEYALPLVRKDVPDKGVVSTGCVNALLAKVYAQMPTPNWNKVNTYCDAVTGLGYDLVPDYASLFSITGKNSIESIWETQFDGTNHGNWMTGMTTPWVWGDWKKFYIPTQSLVNAFNAENDAIRKNASVKFINTSWQDDYWPQPLPVIYKYADPDQKSDIIRLRYADILLLKAEALINNNDIPGAMNIVNNKIRKRVNLPAKTAANANEAKLIVETERRLELAFEGVRWYDLVRTGRAIDVMNAQKDGKGNSLNYNVTAEKLYFPIPQNEVDRNPGINK